MKKEQKCIYIMLTDTGTWLSRLVKRYTDAPYNHVSIGLDEELTSLYSFGRKRPKNPFYGGFVKEDVAAGIYSHFPNTTCVIYRMRVTDKQYKRIRKIIRKFERSKSAYTYNFLGLLTLAVDKPLQRKSAYFCSQFVAEVLKRANVEVFDKHPGLVQPNDFRQLKDVDLVYEGKLYEYEKIVERLTVEEDLQTYPRFRLFVKPIRKTVKFINPMYYYDPYEDRSSGRGGKEK